MAVSLNGFLIELYQEYLEEASFLYEQRLTLFNDLRIPWRDIADFEDRLEPHIDGLVIGGELALEVCREQAESEDFGELHAAVRVFCRQRRMDLLEQVLDRLDGQDEEKVKAVIDAIKYELPDEWQPALTGMLSNGSDFRPRLAANVIGFRRLPLGGALIRAMRGNSSRDLPSFIWALGRIRDRDAASELTARLKSGDESLRPSTALALLRMEVPQIVEMCLAEGGKNGWPVLPVGLAGARSHAQGLIAAGPGPDGAEWNLTLGVLGAVSCVEPLLASMREEELAPSAAAGLNLITGAKLYEEVFVPDKIDEDELFEEERERIKAGQSPNPPGRVYGATLPRLSRDPALWENWWLRNRSDFRPQTRYRNGRPYSPACLVENLRAERNPVFIRQLEGTSHAVIEMAGACVRNSGAAGLEASASNGGSIMSTGKGEAPKGWQGYSEHFLETALAVERRGALRNPDGCGKATSACGDTVVFFLRIREHRIQAVTYEADGCLHTHACAGAVAAMVEGKPVESAWRLGPSAVVDYLETLPVAEIHCAEMAIAALRQALIQWREYQRCPWKRGYRRGPA
jgi:uncharacterized protein (TIGR02270 family)